MPLRLSGEVFPGYGGFLDLIKRGENNDNGGRAGVRKLWELINRRSVEI